MVRSLGSRVWFPLHATTCDALQQVQGVRDRIVKESHAPSFLSAADARRSSSAWFRRHSTRLSRQIGLRKQDERTGPRIHDLRHRMAVQTLLRWYRNGDEPERRLPALATYLGHVHVSDTYWYLTACPELMGEAVKRLERRGEVEIMTHATPIFAVLLQGFFTQRLMKQREASPHTIGSYRDTFRLLLRFAQTRLQKTPSRLEVSDIDAPLVAAFLEEMEKDRKIAARSRNLRLTAIRSFFRYAALEAPDHSAQIQRILAIPSKRHTASLVTFLNQEEVEALLEAPDQRSWLGRRDHVLLLLNCANGNATFRR